MEKQFGTKSEMTEWLIKNKAYDYYIVKFDRILVEMEYAFVGERAYLFYKSYLILILEIDARQIFVVNDYSYKDQDNNYIIQKKLHHEYCEFFGLRNEAFRIVQTNLITLEKYLNRVTSKIDAGFEKYTQLLNKEMLTSENTGYFKIEINNAFSLSELNELLQAYNRLYSLVDILLENGCEDITEENVETLIQNHNLILESITIGSKGDLFTVGKEIVLILINSLLNAAFESNKREYEIKKAELEREMAESQLFIQHRQEVNYLISTLDRYMEIKANGSNTRTLPYIQNEITLIVARIEKLQGSNHISLMV